MSSQTAEKRTPLLRIHNISFSYSQSIVDTMFRGSGNALSTPFFLKEVSLELYPKEAFGLIGESTCGKSTLGKIIIQLLRPSQDDGLIEFKVDGFKGSGNIFSYSRANLREYRKRVQMIFQNPDASLNPGMKVRELIIEAIQSCPKKRYDRVEVSQKMDEYLHMMNLQDQGASYPDTLSGGEKRRVSVIRALALEPDLIIADEPFANLDVSLRNHLINIFQRLKIENRTSFLFILHDIDVAYYLCERIAVMYLGRIVEIGVTSQLLAQPAPKHPYTDALIAASETLKYRSVETDADWQTPELIDISLGCVYRNRCPRYRQLSPPEQNKCENEPPDLRRVEENHKIACHFWQR